MVNLYLDLEDDLSAIIQKVREAKEDNLNLVIPQNSSLFQNRLSLKLLLKSALEVKKDILIVSSNKLGLSLAKESGINGVENLEEAEILRKESEDKQAKEKKLEESADELGFVENEDIAQILPGEAPDEEVSDRSKLKESKKVLRQAEPIVPISPQTEKVEDFGKFSASETLSAGSGKKKFYKKGIFWLLLIFGSLILGLSGFMFWQLPRADVSLYVQGESLDKRLELVGKTSILEPNLTSGEIPAIILEAEETGTKKIAATGKKMIGEKAEGSLTIQNWTDEVKSIPAGTVMTVASGEDSAGLTFITASAVSIPPQTFEIPEEGQKLYVAGQEGVSVTATQVGEDYNLSGGTNFLVGAEDFSEFKAVNEDNFEGGMSEEITIVAEIDRQNLLNSLATDLYEKGKKDVESKLVGDQRYDLDGIENEIVSTVYDASVGEEKDELGLTLTTKSSTVAFSESHVRQLISHYLKESVPSGFDLTDAEITVEIEKVQNTSEGIKVTVLGTAAMLPEINPETFKKRLIGLRPWEAEELLKNEPKVIGYQVELWPPLPKILQFMPHQASRLEIQILENHDDTGN